MRRLTRSFYAKVFLMFMVTILTLYGLNQVAINVLGPREMKAIIGDRLIAINLRWGREQNQAGDDEQLKTELLASLKSARPDEVMVMSAPLADKADPDHRDKGAGIGTHDDSGTVPGGSGSGSDRESNGKRYGAPAFPLPAALSGARIERLHAGKHFPTIERALITFDGRRWDATSVITPDRQIVSLVDTAVAERYMTEFLEFRDRMIHKVLPFTLAVFVICTWFMTRNVLAPIRRVQRSLSKLNYRDLSVRLPARGEDNEFRAFVETFNTMLERLERGFLQASRFSSDAAHELRTPLTIMQGHVERALIESEPGSRQQAQLRLVCDEIERLAGITQKLLLLAQADAGRLALDVEAVDVSDMLEEMRADIAMLDPALETRGRVAPDLRLDTDRALLQQMFNNLFSNAVKYNEPDGWIDISAWAEGSRMHVRFTNPTWPLPDGFEAKVFERFSRGDASHSRRIDGTGLGLSLSREIAVANGGTLTFRVRNRSLVEVEFIAALSRDNPLQGVSAVPVPAS